MRLWPPPRPFPPTGGQNRHSGRQPLPQPPSASYHVPKPVGRPWASSARPGLPLPQASVLRYLKMWILPFRQTCRNGTPSDPERPAPPRVLPGPASRGEEGISKGRAKPSRLPSSGRPRSSPAGRDSSFPRLQTEPGLAVSSAYLSRWELQGVVLQKDALQVSQETEADREAGDQVAGKVQPHQRKLGQLCGGKGGGSRKGPGGSQHPSAQVPRRGTRPGEAGGPTH